MKQRKRIRKSRRVLYWVNIVLLTMFVATVVGTFRIVTLLNEPQALLEQPLRIEIPDGISMRTTLKILKEKHLLRRPWLLELLFRWYRSDRRIQAGLYEFKGSPSTWDIYSRLLSGQILTVRITILEGWDRFNIADYLSKQGYGRREVILEGFHDKSLLQLIRTLDDSIDELEGFLYPSTYDVKEPATWQKLFALQVREFLHLWTPAMIVRVKEMGWTIKEVVTLASLVEKETSIPEERPIVASVFLNRIRQGMRLECDPTVIYAWKIIGRNPIPLLRADLEVQSLYNTYKHPGLPPGPIANPGIESIYAVLYPASTDYLYFVADGNGGHRFSRSYRGHLESVRKYRKLQKNSR